MKNVILIAISSIALLSAAPNSFSAQNFDAGSNGSFGALNVTENTTLDLPPTGIFHCTTINVAAGITLSFNRNELNTPVYLLAQGDVVIDGSINVSGKDPASPYAGGKGGPGGFDGGAAGYSNGAFVTAGGDGFGPGGGEHGIETCCGDLTHIGSGSYGSRNESMPSSGKIYGSPALIPLIGGSGGGGVDGNKDAGGGGGGGAILIASNTRILVNAGGLILSHGGRRHNYNGGSSGAIRLVAPRVYGKGTLAADGNYGGHGRVRIDSIFKYEPTDPSQNLAITMGGTSSIGSTLIVFPPNQPRLDITLAAGTSIPEGTQAPVLVQLPFGSDPNQNVTIQAKNFGATIPIEVVLTPQSGDAIRYQAEINNTGANAATVTVPVVFPINQIVRVSAWTK